MTNPTAQLPAHLSYSQASTFLSCGEKYKLERLDGHRGTPNWASLGGSAVHQMTEDRDRRLWESGEAPGRVDVETFVEVFEGFIVREEGLSGMDRTAFRHTGRKSKDWPDKWGYDYWVRMGPEWVAGWESWRDNSPWKLWSSPDENGIELQFDLKLGDTSLRGAIDRIMETPTGDLVVVDLKTSARHPNSAEQLGLYACAVESIYGVRPKYGAYWMARDGGTGPVYNLDRFSLDYMQARYATVRRQMERGEFLAKPGDACSYCPVRTMCSIQGD